jgi:hypothetical protein
MLPGDTEEKPVIASAITGFNLVFYDHHGLGFTKR